MIFFHTSSAVAPFTMLVAEIAPGLTSGFISGAPAPTTVLTPSTAMIELNRAPVASTPMRLRDRVESLLLDDLRGREDLRDGLDGDLGLEVARRVHLAVRGHDRDAEQLRIDLGEGRNVVGVLALLQVLVLRVGGIDRLLDVGRRLREGAGAEDECQRHHDGADACEVAFISTLQSVCEKLYLNENCTLTPSEWKPSAKFSRRPHWNSPPIITFGTGRVEQVEERVLPALVRIGGLAFHVVVVGERVAHRCSRTARSRSGRGRPPPRRAGWSCP